ncbi:MAG: hypothetical protein IJ273_02515 [Alphaproteobacteria bacterium]|nr:hypothetical protein [Alphaproteobacteria bacterium]
MTKHFHGALNRMALFTALLVAGVLYFWADFMQISIANIWLNGVIIGTSLFGIGLCFVQIFALLPEYKWLHGYTTGRRGLTLPPYLLRPVAQMLGARPRRISATTLNGFMEMILMRFEDARESVRYITNTLIFLGLLGTFWGLILTVGGFAELIGNLNFSDEMVLQSMQAGLSRPLAGMATAFTSSLLGLGGSLTVGFLSLQVQTAQNAIYHELEYYLAAHTHVSAADDVAKILPQINLATHELTRSINSLEQTISDD